MCEVDGLLFSTEVENESGHSREYEMENSTEASIFLLFAALLWHCECIKAIKDGNKSLILSEGPMRSDLVFAAITHVSNRFALVRVLARATRKFHKPGTRIQETTNEVLARFGCANPVADENAVRVSAIVSLHHSTPQPEILRRAKRLTVHAVHQCPAPSEASWVPGDRA
jgi:hypothetical protein